MKSDFEYMKIAYKEARKAAAAGEIPVGAVIVDKNGDVLSTGRNRREEKQSPVLHAEIDAIIKAAEKLNSWRLEGCTLYVTLEPCPMCAGAIINSRIERLVFGAYDEKGGAAGSICNIFEMPFNHKVWVSGGIMENECSNVLTEFFKGLR